MHIRFHYFLLSTLVSLLLVCLPYCDYACSVCGGAYSEEQINAYLIVTAILAFLVLGIALGFGIWVYRRYRVVPAE